MVYEDRTSGKSFAGRPELMRALEDLRPGDCLVLAAWDSPPWRNESACGPSSAPGKVAVLPWARA